jgi:hypothetical protein
MNKRNRISYGGDDVRNADEDMQKDKVEPSRTISVNDFPRNPTPGTQVAFIYIRTTSATWEQVEIRCIPAHTN